MVFNTVLIDSDLGAKRNKLETHLLEIPIEFRIRNSTPTEYKFWRFYFGAKLGYAFGNRSKLVTDIGKDSFYVTDVKKFRYGLMANFGYNTFNIHVYYALTNLFKDGITARYWTGSYLYPLACWIYLLYPIRSDLS